VHRPRLINKPLSSHRFRPNPLKIKLPTWLRLSASNPNALIRYLERTGETARDENAIRPERPSPDKSPRAPNRCVHLTRPSEFASFSLQTRRLGMEIFGGHREYNREVETYLRRRCSRPGPAERSKNRRTKRAQLQLLLPPCLNTKHKNERLRR